jgi:Zn-dependent oligopeptidase
MVHLKQQARNNLQKHIHETSSAEYQKACNTLNQVLRITWSIVSKTEDEKTRLQALALINDVNKYRTELVTNDVIVDGALRIVQSKMDHLSGEEKRLLRDIKQGISSQEPELEEQEEQELKATNGVC